MHEEGGKEVETWGMSHVITFRAESEARRNMPRFFVKLQIDVYPIMLASPWICRSCLSRLARPLLRRSVRLKSTGKHDSMRIFIATH
jgi:hypothetical protein